MRKLIVTSFAFLAISGVMHAQDSGSNDVTPLLLPGLSNRQHPISTKNSEAQKYFDQGLMLVFGFNRAEAVRSFRRAAQLDDSAAMPYWGMSLAYGRHMNMDPDMDVQNAMAYAAIQQALNRSNSASEKEQECIRALAKRSSADDKADGRILDENYAAAMTQLAARYPDDVDARALSIEARMMAHRYDWFHETMPQEGTSELIGEIEQLLRRDPDHPLANHLYIHLLDTGHPELALGTAYHIVQLAPGLGHLTHMAGHIFFNLGDYESAARVNEMAAATEREYMRLAQPAPNVYTLVYYMHDLHFVSRARAEQGLFAEAKRPADEVADYIAPLQNQWPMFSDYYLPLPLLVLLRFKKWDEIINIPEPDPNRRMDVALWHFGRALAFARKGQRQRALEEKAVLEEARRTLPADTMWMFNKGEDLLTVALLVLKARLESEPMRAVEEWQRAVKAQDALSYDEPPAWYYPIRESLGAALLRTGNTSEAETTFRECLRQNPRDGRALFGLIETLKAQKNMDAAQWVQREFESSWKAPRLQLRLDDL